VEYPACEFLQKFLIVNVTVCSKKGGFTIVPILVGSIDQDSEKEYGKLLSKYLADPQNLFVISSDFCHWGMLLLLVIGKVSFSFLCELLT